MDTRTESPAPDLDGIPPWDSAVEGDIVEVQRRGESVGVGEIDVMTADGSMVWILMHDGRGRILVHSDDGALVRIQQE